MRLITDYGLRTTVLLFIVLAIPGFTNSVQAHNTNLNFLTLGASMNYMYEGDEDGRIGGDGRSRMISLSSEYYSAHTNYLAWKNDNIYRLIGDWTNNTLSTHDQQYIRIIQADFLYRAQKNRFHDIDSVQCEQYFTDVAHAGETAMKKGYRGETLTSNDWEDLKVYRLQDDIQNVGTENLPYMLNMTYAPNQSGAKLFDIGMASPKFRLPKLETVLKRANYNNGVRVDPAYAFYERGTNRYGKLFSGYTTNNAAPYDVTHGEVIIPPGETSNDFVEIGVARDKPMVVIPVQLSDGYWFNFNAHDVIPIYNAYKDVADFYFIHLQYHDVSAALTEFFGDNAGKWVTVMDMETSEELAAEAKNVWMRYPWFAVPTIVDVEGSIARNAFVTQGGDSLYFIIDKNGKIAYDGKMYINNNYKPYAEDFSGGTAWANLMERELLKVLDNNGEFVPTNVTDWTDFEVGATKADRRTCRLTDATVVSVDLTSNIVVVSKNIGGSDKQFSIEIGTNTRISNKEDICDLSAFAPGDTITVKFWEDTYPSVTCSPNYNYTTIPDEKYIGKRVVRYEVTADTGDGIIRNPRQLNKGTVDWSLSLNRMAWTVGTLESISSTSRHITVSLNVDTNAMYGYKFWQQDAGIATRWGFATYNMNILSQWLSAKTNNTKWTFVIDDDVDIFINSENAAYDDLTIRSPIGLLYRTYQNGNNTIVYPELLRLSVSDLSNSAPTNATVIINNDDVQTTNFVVCLNLFAENPTPVDMQISELSDFSDASWIPYQTNYTWTFEPPFGEKTVYARFSNGGAGISDTASDTIDLVPEPGGVFSMIALCTLGLMD